MSKFRPLDSRRKSADVADQIRELAIQRDLRPGERLPGERELAREFNVSRSGLREALLLLEAQGFIAIKRGRNGGAFIQGMHSRPVAGAFGNMLRLGQVSIDQLLEARLGIEVMVLGFAGHKARSRWLKELASNLERAEALRERAASIPGGRAALLANLHEFHHILAGATKNPVFMLAAETMMGIISRHLEDVGHEGYVSLESIREHRAIFEALAAGRLDEAQRALEAHLRADSRRTRALLNRRRREGHLPQASHPIEPPTRTSPPVDARRRVAAPGRRVRS